MLTFDELRYGFRELGLERGDVVVVHSSYKSLGPVEGGPQTVIDALLDVLGPEGTLVVPTFTFNFCDQFNKTGEGYFDVQNTISEMGILTEIVRKMPGTKRTVDPIYSFAIFGKHVEEFASVRDNVVFGKKSLFAKLYEYDAKQLIIGLSYNNSWTYVHYVEEMIGVDYRYHKGFTGFIVNGDKKYKDTYYMNVRDISKGVRTAVDPMGVILEERGIVNKKKIGNTIVKLLTSSKKTFDDTAEMLKKNPKLFYEIEN